jgi:hypothetical protein
VSDDTLTCRATGPAEATLRDDHGDATIATTIEVELEATLEIDAEWLNEHGYVSKRSEASLHADDVARVICETRSGDDGTFRPLEGWTIELSAAFETWAGVAIDAAKSTLTIGGDDAVANAACLVLDGLAEHAVSDRPRLVMLDVVGSYDPSDYSRAEILGTLTADIESLPATTPTAEAAADD